MQHKMDLQHRSEDEYIKEAGLVIDLDEIGRKGALSKAEKTIAKWYGIYGSRQPGAHMARVVTPGAVMTSAQARNIAGIAERYGQGVLNLTTRQAIQFHWLKAGNLADMIRELAGEGSSTMHGCGDVTRQISVCPLAETCPHRRLNVRPWAQRAQKALGDMRDLDNLPRKFKITFSGCEGGCAQPYINCLGFVAIQRSAPDGSVQAGFRVVAGGGLGWAPFIGQEVFGFIPEARALDVARAIALTFRDHGDRYNRSTSRLKFVLARDGLEALRRWTLEHLEREGKPTADLVLEPVADSGAPVPDRPLTQVGLEQPDGSLTVRAMVPMGEMNHHQLIRAAELAEEFADQKLYTNNRQNLEFHGVDARRAHRLKEALQQAGFGIEGFYGLRDMVPCVGTTYCPKAVTETRALYRLLEPVVADPRYAAIQDRALINISGCPNSCSQWRIADLGFRGLRIREEQGSVEGYEILIGGDNRTLGQILGDFKLADCPAVVRTILDTFLDLRQDRETLRDTLARTGLAPFKKAVYGHE